MDRLAIMKAAKGIGYVKSAKIMKLSTVVRVEQGNGLDRRPSLVIRRGILLFTQLEEAHNAALFQVPEPTHTGAVASTQIIKNEYQSKTFTSHATVETKMLGRHSQPDTSILSLAGISRTDPSFTTLAIAIHQDRVSRKKSRPASQDGSLYVQSDSSGCGSAPPCRCSTVGLAHV